MPGRRWKRIFINVGASGILAVIALLVLHSRQQPTPVWQLVAVRAYDVRGEQPASIYGSYQVEADFDCRGLDLAVQMPNRFRRLLARWRILPAPRIVFPRWNPAPVILRDEGGRELIRLQSGGAVSTQSSRMSWSNAYRGRITVLWNFDLAPGRAPAGPIHFTTSLGVNGMPAVPVEVVLNPPPAATSMPAAQHRSQ